MNDKLFLLSIEEYKKYEDIVPKINVMWWLRSPGSGSNCAAIVYGDGSLHSNGYYFRNIYNAVRPVLRIEKSSNLKVGDRIMAYNFPFIVIDAKEGLAIAEVPIAFRRFDNDSNDYKKSEIRQFLLDWVKNRDSEATIMQHDKFRQLVADSLSIYTIIDLLTALSVAYIHAPNEAEKVSIRRIWEHFSSLHEALKTDKACPHCGCSLYLSDLPNYAYVCAVCDENFYECEVQ